MIKAFNLAFGINRDDRVYYCIDNGLQLVFSLE